LVTYRGGIPARRRSPIPALCDERRYHSWGQEAMYVTLRPSQISLPQNLPNSRWESGLYHLIRSLLSLSPDSPPQTASRWSPPFFQNTRSLPTDRRTDRPSDRTNTELDQQGRPFKAAFHDILARRMSVSWNAAYTLYPTSDNNNSKFLYSNVSDSPHRC